MDEHEDDLASEVIEGEEIESDAFEAEDADVAQNAEDADEEEDESPIEDPAEL